MSDLKKLKEIEDSDIYSGYDSVYPPEDMVAFNELRSCADLFRMYDKGQLEIQPEFQRNIVWNKPHQTRFIDSLLKQLPIPSLCIAYDSKNNKRIVIDGLQRIYSIVTFLGPNKDFRLSELSDIDSRISGKSVADLDSKVISIIENVTIPITVIRCYLDKDDHKKFLFTIFQRLNTGGMKLNNQEIRNCIYSGRFNSLLKEIAKSSTCVKLFGKSVRFNNEELLLRFLAFSEDLDNYTGKLSGFLSDFMNEKQKKMNSIEEQKLQGYLKNTLEVYKKLSMSHKLENSKTIREAVLLGIGKNLPKISEVPESDLVNFYNNLIADEMFSADNLKEGLSEKSKVINRLKEAIRIFRG